MSEILVLNGPNLNLLGTREPEHYGQDTLEGINGRLSKVAKDAGVGIQFFQSNAEHELITRVQEAIRQKIAFILINPAGFTHTSVALRDALAASNIPFIEVHLSNIHSRESFRKHSYFSDLARGVISGLGAQSYELALAAAIHILKQGQ
ncbi:MAG: type II 3-dehydroquinate dehydratase [Gammaproteobacteria bacterium]|nr:type II 3-dehydroquinate dehydratase [Gammaproteobacteria bacterium]